MNVSFPITIRSEVSGSSWFWASVLDQWTEPEISSKDLNFGYSVSVLYSESDLKNASLLITLRSDLSSFFARFETLVEASIVRVESVDFSQSFPMTIHSDISEPFGFVLLETVVDGSTRPSDESSNYSGSERDSEVEDIDQSAEYLSFGSLLKLRSCGLFMLLHCFIQILVSESGLVNELPFGSFSEVQMSSVRLDFALNSECGIVCSLQLFVGR
jgi:hypothetical protein